MGVAAFQILQMRTTCATDPGAQEALRHVDLDVAAATNSSCMKSSQDKEWVGEHDVDGWVGVWLGRMLACARGGWANMMWMVGWVLRMCTWVDVWLARMWLGGWVDKLWMHFGQDVDGWVGGQHADEQPDS